VRQSPADILLFLLRAPHQLIESKDMAGFITDPGVLIFFSRIEKFGYGKLGAANGGDTHYMPAPVDCTNLEGRQVSLQPANKGRRST
jgi:hypothetical protein